MPFETDGTGVVVGTLVWCQKEKSRGENCVASFSFLEKDVYLHSLRKRRD